MFVSGVASHIFCRMLKKSLFSPAQPWCAKTHLSPGCIFASLRPSTYPRDSWRPESLEGVFPFAKIGYKGERLTRSAVCTSSARHSLRPCRTGVGRVRSLTLFDHPLIEFLKAYFQTESGFSLAAGLPPLMCSSKIVDTSASVTLEYQVASG